MVHAFAGELQAKQIAIELQTVGSVLDDNRRVIDAEKELAIRVLPARVAFFWGKIKIDDLQVVTVGIFKIKGTNTCGGFVGGWNCLGPGGSVPNFVSAQLLIGFVNIADYDGGVLEPAVVGARVDGNRPALRREIFRIPCSFRSDSRPGTCA